MGCPVAMSFVDTWPLNVTTAGDSSLVADEDLMNGPEGDLCDEPGIPVLDLLDWPGDGGDFVAGHHVLVVALRGNHRLRWQFEFDYHFFRFGPVEDPEPVREPFRVRRRVQGQCAELRDGFRIACAEVALELIYLCVVRRRGFSRGCCLALVFAAEVRYPALSVGLGGGMLNASLLVCYACASLVPFMPSAATEQPGQPAWRKGSKLLPSGLRSRAVDTVGVKRRNRR